VTVLQTVVVNAADPPALAVFWAGLLGEQVVESSEDWARLEGTLAFQRDPVPKAGPNRLHLDVKVDDLAESTVAAVTRGARPVSDVLDVDSSPWRVFADPEGNEFCLVTG
jgi:predicted enzyme related to lactoylglutathione lyase